MHEATNIGLDKPAHGLNAVTCGCPTCMPRTKVELMPNCSFCGEFDAVSKSNVPELGSHCCGRCRAWFTPAAQTPLPDASPAPTECRGSYHTLNPDFLKLMDEIGVYGLEKYGDQSMEAKFRRGDFSRTDRTRSEVIGDHSANHFYEYLDGKMHDYFGTRKHQLAAAAFNAMMEYVFFINECRKEVTEIAA